MFLQNGGCVGSNICMKLECWECYAGCRTWTVFLGWLRRQKRALDLWL